MTDQKAPETSCQSSVIYSQWNLTRQFNSTTYLVTQDNHILAIGVKWASKISSPECKWREIINGANHLELCFASLSTRFSTTYHAWSIFSILHCLESNRLETSAAEPSALVMKPCKSDFATTATCCIFPRPCWTTSASLLTLSLSLFTWVCTCSRHEQQDGG